MQERPENFNAADDGSEATLVAPRFDAEEARRAHPVVPLAEARPRASFAGARMPSRRGLGRSWTPALLAVALLAVAAVAGAVVTKVLRSPQSNPAAQVPAEAPPAQAAQPKTPTAAPTPPDEARMKRQTPNRATHGREALNPAEPAPADAEEPEDEDEGRRGRGKGRERRRSRAEDEAEKEARKVLKRMKEKAPRLVDVLTSP